MDFEILGILLGSTLWVCLLLSTVFYGVDLLVVKLNSWKYRKLPLAGVRSSFAPQILHNAFFALRPIQVVTDGYRKFGRQAFRVIRNDGNIVVLPHDLLEELSTLPLNVADPHVALERDFLGSYTGLDRMVTTSVHRTAVRWLLNPLRLLGLTAPLQAAFNDAFDTFFPKCDDWTEFSPFQVFEKLSARSSSTILVGNELCQTRDWMHFTINYPKNVMATVIILRLFPCWTHSTLSYLLPTYWSCQRSITRAKKFITPYFCDLLQQNRNASPSAEKNDKASCVLEWLASSGRASEQNPEELMHILVLLTLASMHTTLTQMINLLYDLVANPHLLSEVRAEIDSVVEKEHGWNPSCYDQLEKLDSIMCESQRMTPATTLSMKRMFKEPHTFSDGLHIPRGTYACLPAYPIENDPNVIPNPHNFDGLRAYKNRHHKSQPESSQDTKRNGYSFVSPDRNALSFGHGKLICPGRFYACLVIKMLFVKLISEYDFEFLPGTQKPKAMQFHEGLICSPWQKIRVKRKAGGVCPF